jgi:hypothetical protein
MIFRALAGRLENRGLEGQLMNMRLAIVLSGKTLTQLLANPATSGTIRAAKSGLEDR